MFLSDGYVGTSTAQIAAASSISKRTIYKYFAGKEGLFTALITDVCDSIHDPFVGLTDQMRSAADAHTAVGPQQSRDVRRLQCPLQRRRVDAFHRLWCEDLHCGIPPRK
ncbi:TetR/AcrR family transcriptional regulator [Arthrobacter sp. TWP1-1]|uniref:TetR/AcrR family transcriptional regulator n=1 Tax=Arthrobacter sp. TWP1-1 TaxID=2804568 RepID=UPI003CF1AB8E